MRDPFFAIDGRRFDIDAGNSFIRETCSDYKTLWDIKITAKEGRFGNGMRCRPDIRGDAVVVPRYCLHDCQGRLVDMDRGYRCENEDVPYTLYVSSHIDLHANRARFGHIVDSRMPLHWTGRADLFMGSGLERDVPVEIQCTLDIESRIAPDQFVSPSLFLKEQLAFFADPGTDPDEVLWACEEVLERHYITTDARTALVDFLVDAFMDQRPHQDIHTELLYLLLTGKHIELSEKQMQTFEKMEIDAVQKTLANVRNNVLGRG